jgi:2-amino-4-hydroxy-6-hydroxymethyldihydropteridine diphosphokinase
MSQHRAFIALGSNLKQPADQVRRASQAIAKLVQTRLIRQSSLYRSAPVGYDNQPDFINAVAEVETMLSPDALLHAILDIEQAFGRERPFPNAPRILDLDLLLYDDLTMRSDTLTLPHPRMHTRAFVMLPLAEIAPDLHLAGHGNVVKLAQSLENQTIEKLDCRPA